MMNKVTFILLVMGFFALSSCKDQKEDLIGSESLKGQTLASQSGKKTEDFTPPTRLRGKKRHNVKSYGAVGDGIHDDTDAFQAAIDSLPEDGGTVFVPPGTYLINGDQLNPSKKEIPGNCIRLRSNMHLEFGPHAKLKQIPSGAYACTLILAYQVENIEISGGEIIGERYEHTNTWEGVHGIRIKGSNHVTVRDMRMSDFFGDGITIGTTDGATSTKIKSNDVVINNIVSTNNRRQGLSIGPATNVQVWNSEFSDTQGTAPQCGIDIEPDAGLAANTILIQNCIMRNNHAYGILLFKNIKNVTIKGCEVADNNIAGIVCDSPADTYIISNEIHHNTNNGLIIKAGVRGMSVYENTFYQNNGNAPRPSILEITGINTEVKREIFMPAGSSGVTFGLNFYK